MSKPTPIRPPYGTKVHAMSETDEVTLCRVRFSGWAVVDEDITCLWCLARMEKS